ncbi:peptidase family C50-domain-containing protein [Auriculariales sp. MPI-PUGE-AT-0066]|nr:peptidase family C50-domain-containing protein [Auriculariales sp. MPI-PUGE-AT-0066]
MPPRPLKTRTTVEPRAAVKKAPPNKSGATKVAATAQPTKAQATAAPLPPTRKQLVADINAASQQLSAIAKAGWKATASTQSEAASSYSSNQVKTLATTLQTQLAALRVTAPGDVDVEHAAVSVLGKLAQIELFELALNLALDIRPALAALYHPIEPIEPLKKPVSAMTSSKATKQLTATRALPQQPLYDHSIAHLPLPRTRDAHHSRGTLLDWHPLFGAQQVNNFLRVPFQCIPRHLAAAQAPPVVLFRVRTWTLECLLKLNELDFEGFWNQAVIFASLYTKAVTTEASTVDACTSIGATFATLVRATQKRQDGTSALAVKSFATFTQRWMQFAKKINDLDTLNFISRIMDNSSLNSSHSSDSQMDGAVSAEKIVSKISVAALQSVELMERFPVSLQDPSLVESLSRVSSLLNSWNRTTNLHASSSPSTDLLDRISRAISKLRRISVDSADMWIGPLSNIDLRNAMQTTLSTIIETVDNIQARWNMLKDSTNGIIDALIVLAKITMKRSPTDAHGYLERALRIARAVREHEGSTDATADLALANRLRVISAALYMHALFLKSSCEVGQSALERSVSDTNQTQWSELKTHLPKRWELHGVCSFKLGDRAVAMQSYRASIAARAESLVGLSDDLQTLPPSRVFAKPEHIELAALLERDAYLAANDLMLPGEQVSLKFVELADIGQCVLGALIEWQIVSLRQSFGKDHVRDAAQVMCQHAVACYAAKKWPVKRARAMLRQLEVHYLSPTIPDDWENLIEVVVGLTKTEHLYDDTGLSAYCTQYTATAYLIAALLAHRTARPGSEADVLKHAESAIVALKEMMGIRQLETRDEPDRRLSQYNAAAPDTKNTRGGAKAKTPAPPKGRATAKTVPKTAPATMRRGRAAASEPPPVTPAPTRRGAKKMPVSASPAKTIVVSKLVLKPVRDDWKHLYGLLQSTAQLLGLLGHTFVRIQILKLMRHLSAEVDRGSEEFIRSSVDLAAEYADLGLVDRCLEVLGRARIQLFGEDIDDHSSLPPSALAIDLLLLSSRMLAEMDESELSITEFRKAARMCEMLDDPKSTSSALRIRDRTLQLERTARACGVFACIELSRDDPYSAMGALTQALRLWNRAIDNLARIAQQPEKAQARHKRRDSNPFDMTDLKDVLSDMGDSQGALSLTPAVPAARAQLEPNPSKKAVSRTSVFDGLQWRVTEGLLKSMFTLARMYNARGSARESQFFLKQALELAKALGAPVMQARAHARQAELSLQLRDLEAAINSLQEAEQLSKFGLSIDLADIQRIHGMLAMSMEGDVEPSQLFSQAASSLLKLGQEFAQFEIEIVSPKRPNVHAVVKSIPKQSVSPTMLASILRHQIWLQRDSSGNYEEHMTQLVELLQAVDIKSEHMSLMAQLAVHAAQVQLSSDLFLSSLTESTITIPMRVSATHSKSTREILASFSNAEGLLLNTLEHNFERGHVCQVRDAALSLASISALQASLGKKADTAGHVAAGLLNLAAAITLERELLDVIQGKMTGSGTIDDLVWPTFTARGTPKRKLIKPKPKPKRNSRYVHSDDEDEAEEEDDAGARTLSSYWGAVRERHRPLFSQAWQPKEDVDELPDSWTIVSISVTEDKKMMFVSRQRPKAEPLVFCVPLQRHHRQEEDMDGENQLTYTDATTELHDIIRGSNDGLGRATDVRDSDNSAKAAWWKARIELDLRLKQLLDNIEYCWLGAFKTVLNDPIPLSAEVTDALRVKFGLVFSRGVRPKEKKQISKLSLNPSLVECFLTLEPTCRDEELEDLVYFMLDLYQFNGVPVAAHDIDIDQVIVDLRSLLEESSAKIKAARSSSEDRHLFLVLDKNVQGLPWESVPVLRGRAVSRIPSIAFLMDRLQLSRTLSSSTPSQRARKPIITDRALVNPSKAFYVLNPSGDLKTTENTFTPWLKSMEEEAGWDGIIGRPPSEMEMVNALSRRDLVIYFGHNGGEQYVRSHKVRGLPRCAATMLWGCSSGAMREMGDFDRSGTPDAYMLAGCPTLVANLWDVTDKDIDRLAHSVFQQLRLEPGRADDWQSERTDGAEVSVVAAVATARETCKLKYLTGAAAVVYGIPFYC